MERPRSEQGSGLARPDMWSSQAAFIQNEEPLLLQDIVFDLLRYALCSALCFLVLDFEWFIEQNCRL